MTKKEIDTVAAKVVEKLIKLIGDHKDEEERQILNDVIMHGTEFSVTEEQMLLGEMARLETLRMLFEFDEDFEKCNAVKTKIKVVKYKLDDLDK
jgi:hypothetical protein